MKSQPDLVDIIENCFLLLQVDATSIPDDDFEVGGHTHTSSAPQSAEIEYSHDSYSSRRSSDRASEISSSSGRGEVVASADALEVSSHGVCLQ